MFVQVLQVHQRQHVKHHETDVPHAQWQTGTTMVIIWFCLEKARLTEVYNMIQLHLHLVSCHFTADDMASLV